MQQLLIKLVHLMLRFTGDIELKDFDPPHSYKIEGSGNSPVGFASGEALVKLEIPKMIKQN